MNIQRQQELRNADKGRGWCQMDCRRYVRHAAKHVHLAALCSFTSAIC